MKSDKFFKWIWNFNGLILFVGIILGSLLIVYQLSKPLFKKDTVAPPTLNLAEDADDEEKWSLGYPNIIGNTGFYYVPLESEKLYVDKKGRAESFSMYKYIPTRSKNIVFINSNTNESSWLFKSVKQLITEIRLLSFGNSPKSVIKAISYEVINNDTNNDGVFDNKDRRTFALSEVSGSRYTQIIEGYNRIVESKLNEEGNLFVVFIDNNEVYSMLVDLITFKVIDKKPLPKVGASK
ncbi:hypothetical protein [Colwellia sp. UCD-KL20]|uniref:hypothetical protein n=1 Tax=Colwellia sp. UCD-KL20 TaxID=1917165 RepID=UPI000970922B|nr:hypothetical protein [Colwellia sp. UCD-KL20]